MSSLMDSMSKKIQINKRDVYLNCLEFSRRYIAELASVQEGVFETLKSEFKPEHVCEPTASEKYLKAIERFTLLQSKFKIYNNIVKCYHVWKNKLQPAIGDGLGKNSYAELPLRLAACFILNGDYYKALLCLRHSVRLEPKSLVPRIIFLRWSAYLGEWEMAEMALAFEKAKPPKKNGMDDHLVEQLLFTTEITQAYVDFNRDQKSRPKYAKIILEKTTRANADERLTFPVFETQTFANWITAQLPKVAALKTDDIELLDSLNCLHTAVLKAESIMKNRISAIQKEDAPLDISKIANDAIDLLKACSAYAENCDLRRDYAIELLNTGMIRDGAANSQLGLWCAVKACVFFRVLQFVNVNYLIRECVILPELRKDLVIIKDIIRTVYALSSSSLDSVEVDKYVKGRLSKSGVLVVPVQHVVCTPTPNKGKSVARTTQKSVAASLAESFEELRLESSKTSQRNKSPARIASKLIDSFNELAISEKACSLHELSDRCECNICGLCCTNYNAAYEYWMSRFLYESFSNDSMEWLEKQFHTLRGFVATEQCAVFGKKVKPRPPSSMCETLAMCAVRWLRCLEERSLDRIDSRLYALRDKIVASSLKVCSYSSVRTICYRLSISQLERTRKVSKTRNCEWMADFSRTNWILSAVAQYLFPPTCKAASTNGSEVSEEQQEMDEILITEAKEEYLSYSNLLYRDWRFPICTFLGEHSKSPWEAAMMWSESTLLATRQQSRILSGKLTGFVFSKTSLFKKMVERLPADFTIVHLALSHEGSLYLIKMHEDREPIIIPLASKAKVENVVAIMEKIIEENARTCNLGKVTNDAKAFWAARRAVNNDLKESIPRVQDILLGVAAPLLLPSHRLNSKGVNIANNMVIASQNVNGSQLSFSYAKELVSLATKVEKADWYRLVERILDFTGLISKKDAVQAFYSKIRNAAGNGDVAADTGPCYTFMIVCPDLTTFPWEVVPVFRSSPYVARFPSVHTLFQTLQLKKEIPVTVNVSNAFYVLDPENNLGETRKRITDYVSKFTWNGVIGEIPDPDVVKEALQARDVFFYMGHGSGSRYFSRRMISENTINAVSVLMGCGSVKLTRVGWGMDGKSSVYDYTVAKCPSVVGCLWTVTDGEIDRYFMALVDLCFSSDANRTLTGTNGDDSRLRVLVEAMYRARERCKLPYLTGASVVSYGIPVVASE